MLVTRTRQAFPISDGMMLGRDASCTLVLSSPDGSISRQHAVVSAGPSGWSIRDLNSTNGTFVNGQQVLGATALFHQDLIRVGASFELLVYDPAHPRPAASVATTYMGAPAAPGMPAGRTQQGVGQLGAAPGFQRRLWNTPPQAEGIVVGLRGPIAVDAGGSAGKVIASIGLALVFAPLALLPWISGPNQILVTMLRVQSFDEARQTAVTLMGDLRALIEEGEAIAVWGRVDQGTVYAIDLYIYATDNWLRFRH